MNWVLDLLPLGGLKLEYMPLLSAVSAVPVAQSLLRRCTCTYMYCINISMYVCTICTYLYFILCVCTVLICILYCVYVLYLSVFYTVCMYCTYLYLILCVCAVPQLL